LLWDAGVPTDFVELSELDVCGAAYKVLVVPFPLSLSDEAAAALVSFVESGGFLICEAAAGRLDEHNAARRGEIHPALARLVGARQHAIQMVREPNDEQRWMPVERTWGEFLEAAWLEGQGLLAGFRTPANLYVQTFELAGGEPVLLYAGEPAGVIAEVGKGKALILGTLVGHNALAYQNTNTPAFVLRLLELGGVRSLHQGRLTQRVRKIDAKQAWFFTNSSGEPMTETISIGEAQVEDLLGEPMEQRGDQLILTVQPLDVRVLIVSPR
jgi:hypothetical protein